MTRSGRRGRGPVARRRRRAQGRRGDRRRPAWAPAVQVVVGPEATPASDIEDLQRWPCSIRARRRRRRDDGRRRPGVQGFALSNLASLSTSAPRRARRGRRAGRRTSREGTRTRPGRGIADGWACSHLGINCAREGSPPAAEGDAGRRGRSVTWTGRRRGLLAVRPVVALDARPDAMSRHVQPWRHRVGGDAFAWACLY